MLILVDFARMRQENICVSFVRHVLLKAVLITGETLESRALLKAFAKAVQAVLRYLCIMMQFCKDHMIKEPLIFTPIQKPPAALL